MNKVEELIAASKFGEILHKKEVEKKKKTQVLWVLAIVGAVAAVAAVGYALYKHFTPDCYEAFDDDFEDDFDDEFFEDEDLAE